MTLSQVAPLIQYGRKLLQAVAELHTRGHQKLRVVPIFGGAGFWRCVVVPVHYVRQTHGALLSENAMAASYDVFIDDSHEHYGKHAVKYSSAEQDGFWSLPGAASMPPTRLARHFIKNFPEVASLGYGSDWTYAGWFQHMLHLTYPDALPISRDDTSMDEDGDPTDHMITIGREVRLPMPPPGQAPD